MLIFLIPLVYAQETCKTDKNLCNHVDYVASICKRYKTDVPQDSTQTAQYKLNERELFHKQLDAIFQENKHYKEIKFQLDSMEPNNPDDIETEEITKTSGGFLFAYKLTTTHAITNICGEMKITFVERFREDIMSVEEWELMVSDQLEPFVQIYLVNNPSVTVYDPDAGKPTFILHVPKLALGESFFVKKCNDANGLLQMTTIIKNPIGRIPENFNMVVADSGEYERQWQFDDLKQEFVSDNRGDWMTLKVTTGFTDCEKVNIDGADLCKDYGRQYTFVCRYALGEHVISDSLTVSGSDTIEKAESHGTLAYTLQGGLLHLLFKYSCLGYVISPHKSQRERSYRTNSDA